MGLPLAVMHTTSPRELGDLRLPALGAPVSGYSARSARLSPRPGEASCKRPFIAFSAVMTSSASPLMRSWSSLSVTRTPSSAFDYPQVLVEGAEDVYDVLHPVYGQGPLYHLYTSYLYSAFVSAAMSSRHSARSVTYSAPPLSRAEKLCESTSPRPSSSASSRSVSSASNRWARASASAL